MTWPPAASIRSAAAITSITMNGGTLLRWDAVNRFPTRFLSVASSIYPAKSIQSAEFTRYADSPGLVHLTFLHELDLGFFYMSVTWAFLIWLFYLGLLTWVHLG